MQTARKYTLVPYSQNTLFDPARSLNENVQLYNQNLHRELVQHKRPKKPVEVKIVQSEEEEEEEEVKDQDRMPSRKRKRSTYDMDMLLEGIPKIYQKRMKELLLDRIVDYDDLSGNLLYKNKIVPHSHIGRLLLTEITKSKTTKKKAPKLPGYAEFKHQLANWVPLYG
jgi:hypothetical protein